MTLDADASFPFYTDKAGAALQGGSVYFGTAGLNPITNPATVYWDAAGTQPAAQPIAVSNGYTTRNGTAARVWTSGLFSRLVLDSKGQQVLFESSSPASLRTDLAGPNGALLIGYTPSGGLPTTVGAALAAGRTKLTVNTTYYVRSDGSDANNGLANTAGGAFKTMQHAADVILETLDLNGFNVTVSCAGALTAGVRVSGPWVGGGSVTFTTASASTVTATSSDCFYTEYGARLIVGGNFVLSTVTSGSCIKAYLGSSIQYSGVTFGACAEMHVEQGQNSYVTATGNYSITGGALGHLHAGSAGVISIPSTITIAISNTPAFSTYFMGCAQGSILWSAPTVTGTCTGQKFLAHHGGLINLPQGFASSSIPGSTTGYMNSGGWVTGSGTDALNFAPEIYSANTLQIQAINFNTQVPVTFFKTANDLFTPLGYFYVNGDDSYASGRTHLGCTAAVDVTTGTADGATFRAPSQGFSSLNLSNIDIPTLLARRRNSNGSLATFYRDTTNVGSISVTTTATAFNTSSDYRLKTNVQPIADAWGRVKALKPCRFEFKSDPGNVVSGFIAHELAEVAPNAVHGAKDETEDIGDLDVTEDVFEPVFEVLPADADPLQRPKIIGHRKTGEKTERHPGIARPSPMPKGGTWTKTGTREVYQAVDHSKLVADLAAALQQAMARIEALEAK